MSKAPTKSSARCTGRERPAEPKPRSKRRSSPEPSRSRSRKACGVAPARCSAAGSSRPKRESAVVSAVSDKRRRTPPRPVIPPAAALKSRMSDPVAEVKAKINESVLGVNRCLKACVQFARDAGLALLDAQEHLGDDFGVWVNRTLPVSPAEATALIAFSAHPDVAGVDVSPGTAVPLHRAAELLAVLYEHLAGELRAAATIR